MVSLYEYARFTAPLYETEQYKSVAFLREYLALQERDEHVERNEEIDFFISMVESVDQLRYRAMELYKGELRHRSENAQGPLPLPWHDVAESLFSADKSAPPAQFISHLAEHQYAVIENLVARMRKVLKQKREMTPISRVQKLDATCLRWYSRQPGIRAEEKAGASQKLLAIVKTETYDTLENRVFKDFLKKCCAAARRYCMTYRSKYFASSRYKAVQKLMNLAFYALRNDNFAAVRDIHSVPVPNFVLQYDPVYSRIWAWYLQLLAKTRMVEMLWPKRHVFTADFMKIVITSCLRAQKIGVGEPIFNSELRIRALPENDGLLTDSAFYNNVYKEGANFFEFRAGKYGDVVFLRDKGRIIVSCCYTEDGIRIVRDDMPLFEHKVHRDVPPCEAFFKIFSENPC